ncbi:hypothetical protein BKA62DRAFT_769668 [Auriculariales sp. MPI-PUGE-AT-0066]|nr:hypothetical protein BKA62DRAFT_769668 [Auriculariales sp. MPI-PUGE-AT-0066]
MSAASLDSQSTTKLEFVYRAYLDAINARDWLTVASYISSSGAVHNNRPHTPEQYAEMCNVTSSPYKGIKFIPERILINTVDGKNGTLFCRIRFEYDGSNEPFFEHVVYDFEEGKITRVDSIVEDRKP